MTYNTGVPVSNNTGATQLPTLRTDHQERVRRFMVLARQATPDVPTIPSVMVRLLRAKLIIEEALETCKALGVRISIHNGPEALLEEHLGFASSGEAPDLTEIADGCADVSVVTTGTLIACGIQDRPILEAVDENNLAKFGPGHSWREDGKLIKPPGHKKVDLESIIQAQGR